jgi:hypothetical protein
MRIDRKMEVRRGILAMQPVFRPLHVMLGKSDVQGENYKN